MERKVRDGKGWDGKRRHGIEWDGMKRDEMEGRGREGKGLAKKRSERI